MSALGELSLQCERRGWRLSLDGSYPDGRYEPGLILNCLEVRTRNRELLASVPADADCLEDAAVSAAHALHRQGLIAP